MLDKVLRFFITVFMAIAGATLMHIASPVITMFIGTEILKMDMGIFRLTLMNALCIVIGVIIGVGIGSLTAPYLIRTIKRLSSWVELQLNKMPIHDIIAGVVGLSIGLIIAALLGTAFSRLPIVGNYIPIIFSIVFGYMGIRITIKKREDIVGMFDFVPKLLREALRAREEAREEKAQPLSFISSDGFTMYVGRNNYQNEEVTFRIGSGNDWWFHAKKMPGSHVIVKTGGRELTDRAYEEAGSLAAYYSSGRKAPKVEIDYTQRKNLHKKNGGKPGFVTYHTNYSLMASPDISNLKKAD